MKITFEKDLFSNKLQKAAKFTSSRLVSSAVLQGVVVEGTSKHISLFSTNLSSFYHTTIPLVHEGSFRFIIEPKKVLEFLQFLKPGSIDLDIGEKELRIAQGKTKGVFPLIISDDYPPFPKVEGKELLLDESFFVEKLPLVLFSASSDDTRPALTGINITRSDDSLLLVSTDGFRLSLMKMDAGLSFPPVIIPADFLSEIQRNVKDEKKVWFSYSSEDAVVRFRTNEEEYSSRLVDGEFPPFERIIQSEHETIVTVDREAFLRSVRLISVFARDFSHIVVCEFRKDGVLLRPKKEASGDNSTFMESECNGVAQTVAFNYKFLLDFFNSVSGKTIQIEILRPDAPVTFRVSGRDGYLHVIMPVRLQEE